MGGYKRKRVMELVVTHYTGLVIDLYFRQQRGIPNVTSLDFKDIHVPAVSDKDQILVHCCFYDMILQIIYTRLFADDTCTSFKSIPFRGT